MKSFSILNGKAYVVELPEGAFDPRITQPFGIYLTYNDRFGFNRIKLPPGTWQIVGRLLDVNWDESDIESLESAILADGYYLDENPFGKAPGCGCTGPSDKGACDGCDDWMEADSRVLSRERCLLLRRME